MNEHQITLRLLPWGEYLMPDSGRIREHPGATCALCGGPGRYVIARCGPLSSQADLRVCNSCAMVYSAAKKEYLGFNPQDVSRGYNIHVSRIALLRLCTSQDCPIKPFMSDPRCQWCRHETPYHDACREECMWLLANMAQGATKFMLAGHLMRVRDVARTLKADLVRLIMLQGADMIRQGCYIQPHVSTQGVHNWLPTCASVPQYRAIHVAIMTWVVIDKLNVVETCEGYYLYRHAGRRMYEGGRIANIKHRTNEMYVKLYTREKLTVGTEEYLSVNVSIYAYRNRQRTCLACHSYAPRHQVCELCSKARTLWRNCARNEAIAMIGGGELLDCSTLA